MNAAAYGTATQAAQAAQEAQEAQDAQEAQEEIDCCLMFQNEQFLKQFEQFEIELYFRTLSRLIFTEYFCSPLIKFFLRSPQLPPKILPNKTATSP